MKERPPGVTLLSLLLAGGAVVSILLFVRSAPNLGAPVGDSLALTLFLVVSLVGLIVLGLAGGIGLWFGKPWGWWLAAFYYVYSGVRNANTLLAVPGMTRALGEPEAGVTRLYLEHGGRVVVAILVLLYLYREPILDHFGLVEISKLKSVLILVAVAVALMIVGTAVIAA